MLVLGLLSDTANYSLCAILFLFSWVFVTSYFMGTVAAVEDGGRAAVFILAAQLGGLALGPQLSALVIDNFSLSWMVAGGSAICIMIALCALRSVEYQSELQSLMRYSYSFLCLKKK